jgi:hypothetical protein
LPFPLWGSLSEHQFTFVVNWVRQVALRDSPPLVGTSAET